MTHDDLDNNPPVVVEEKQSIITVDPSFPVMCWSMGVTSALSFMTGYAATGRPMWGMRLMTVTVPITWFMNINDAMRDFERWKMTRRERDRGLPKKLWSYKVKYDWSDHEQVHIRGPKTVEMPKYTGS